MGISVANEFAIPLISRLITILGQLQASSGSGKLKPEMAFLLGGACIAYSLVYVVAPGIAFPYIRLLVNPRLHHAVYTWVAAELPINLHNQNLKETPGCQGRLNVAGLIPFGTFRSVIQVGEASAMMRRMLAEYPCCRTILAPPHVTRIGSNSSPSIDVVLTPRFTTPSASFAM